LHHGKDYHRGLKDGERAARAGGRGAGIAIALVPRSERECLAA
jgi:hypothetical protein